MTAATGPVDATVDTVCVTATTGAADATVESVCVTVATGPVEAPADTVCVTPPNGPAGAGVAALADGAPAPVTAATAPATAPEAPPGEQVSLRRPNSDRQGQRTRKHPHARPPTGAARSEFRAGHGHSKAPFPPTPAPKPPPGSIRTHLAPVSAHPGRPKPIGTSQARPHGTSSNPSRSVPPKRAAKAQQQRTLGPTRAPANPSPHQGPNQAPPPRSPTASLRALSVIDFVDH